jgi:hypothetical protein
MVDSTVLEVLHVLCVCPKKYVIFKTFAPIRFVRTQGAVKCVFLTKTSYNYHINPATRVKNVHSIRTH